MTPPPARPLARAPNSLQRPPVVGPKKRHGRQLTDADAQTAPPRRRSSLSVHGRPFNRRPAHRVAHH
eukprot:5504553-Lingulodinium_polyedra.AAC.1